MCSPVYSGTGFLNSATPNPKRSTSNTTESTFWNNQNCYFRITSWFDFCWKIIDSRLASTDNVFVSVNGSLSNIVVSSLYQTSVFSTLYLFFSFMNTIGYIVHIQRKLYSKIVDDKYTDFQNCIFCMQVEQYSIWKYRYISTDISTDWQFSHPWLCSFLFTNVNFLQSEMNMWNLAAKY